MDDVHLYPSRASAGAVLVVAVVLLGIAGAGVAGLLGATLWHRVLLGAA